MPTGTVTQLFARSAIGNAGMVDGDLPRLRSREPGASRAAAPGRERPRRRWLRSVESSYYVQQCVACEQLSDENGNFVPLWQPVDPGLPPPGRSPALPPPSLPLVGWYQPVRDGHDRWWDGRRWTEHVRHRQK